MTAPRVELIRAIYRNAVEAVLPRTVLFRSVRMSDESQLTIGDWSFDLAGRPVYVIGIGKAAVEMTSTIESILGDRFEAGIVVAKSCDEQSTLRSRVMLGSHPVPDERSLKAGAAVLEFAKSVPDDALVLCLISGGGSALMESLRSGVTLDELRETTQALLRAGASIQELNTVRACMSATKGGGLLAALGHADVVNLIISDVLGDDLSTIASGPTVPPTTSEPAEDVLRRYGVERELPSPNDSGELNVPRTAIVANLSLAIDAAAETARQHGVEPLVLTRSLTGEARDVASTLAAIVADTAGGRTGLNRPVCVIGGGETTVTVRGDGAGGRNTESALAAALRLQGVDGVAMGFLATDGDDGETGVAGGIVTGGTVTESNVYDARRALDESDSYTFLNGCDAAWEPGPTGTNVNDLVIAIVD